ncbi:MAG: radical SAM protein [Sporomusaceae bacterium]|jgi:uncharacterized radical SAM superfamily Fe-S cluster-containing enzyme|nr:radical SAM protein [Sporomusaceae bacterium]
MEQLYSYTMALCPHCGQKVTARIVEKKGKIYLEKLCAQDGISDALICSDPQWYRDSLSYIKPGQEPLAKGVAAFRGCPGSCGLCPEHEQHTCLPVIEINSGCDLDCPVCLKNFQEPFSLTTRQFDDILSSLLRAEGEVNVINLSGGEPTLHEKFGEFLDLAAARGVLQTTVSTNGLTLLDSPAIRSHFKRTGAIAALQFDGFRPSTYTYLRGRDLSREKMATIEILEREGIKYSLVATVARGVNADEIEQIVDFFFRSQALSLMFQPVTFTGQAAGLSGEERRLTIPDVVQEIEKCRDVNKGDFNPLPCSHFSCFALSYYLKIAAGNYLSLKDFLGKEAYLDVIANKTLPGLDQSGYAIIKERIYDFWSAADTSASNEQVLKRLRQIIIDLNELDFAKEKVFAAGTEFMKAIFIHQLMDAETLDFARLMKCCNHYPRPDGRLVPMCAQNVFYQ